MKTYLQAGFDKLKIRVLNKSGIRQIVPADCYRLALEIKAETGMSVSETTLKRVFGFASSVHQPSTYTLNALAEYCGFTSWEDFYTDVEQEKLQGLQQQTWGKVTLNATKISLFNIQSNKYKCGIPYHLTIDREPLDRFIEHFHQSGATVGILSGAAGHGKTIAISRWVEKQISQGHTGTNHDIYLFTNSLSLLQGTAFGYHSNRWLAHLLGFDSSELLDRFMEDHQHTAHGNFYLIIDELHSNLLADRQFHTVISQFIEMVSHFAQYQWFRVILVLRTITLRNYESLFKDTIINPQWFSVLSGERGRKWANMPAFSNAELLQLTRNINGKIEPYHLTQANKQVIEMPLFFQYYHELYGEKLNPSQLTPFDEYLIITQYLKKKVFNGINTMAKQALMEELADLVDEVGGTLRISKRQAYHSIKQHRAAYNDLLYLGILQETGSGLEVRQHTTIQFQSATVASYFIALRRFNRQQEPDELIRELDESPMNKQTKINQLKWLLLFYIECGDLRLVNRFGDIPFTKDHRFEVVAFICDGLEKLGRNHPNVHDELNRTLYNSPFVEFALNHSCFQAEYETNLTKLLAFDLSDTYEVVLRSKVAVISLLKWDEDALIQQLDRLSAIPPEVYVGFVANPCRILSYLYQFFKGKPIDHAAAYELNNLTHRLQLVNESVANDLFDILLFLLVKTSGNLDIAFAYRDILRRRLEKINPANTFEADFTSMVYALYLLECGETAKAASYVSQHSPRSLDNLTYRLLHIIFHIQLGKLNGGAYQHLGHRAIAICETHGFKLLEAYVRILILEELPEEEQLQHINTLKFQFATLGYKIQLGPLAKKYG